MGLDERVFYILLGVLIGFVLGYITRSLKKIEEKVNEVDKHVQEKDRGFLRLPSWDEFKSRLTVNSVALFAVVALTAYSAFATQMNSNDVREQTLNNERDNQNIGAVALCTAEYFSDTLLAVDARTTYSSQQAQANIALQNAQAEFVSTALQEPALEAARVAAALRNYRDALMEFKSVQTKTMGKQSNNPYPVEEDFQSCLAGEMSPR